MSGLTTTSTMVSTRAGSQREFSQFKSILLQALLTEPTVPEKRTRRQSQHCSSRLTEPKMISQNPLVHTITATDSLRQTSDSIQ